MRSLVDTVRAFRGLRVAVVGDAMLDSWREGTASRLCTEGPVPVVRQTAVAHVPGGAANTAANLAALGAEVRFVSIVGADHPGTLLRRSLRAAGVADRWMVADPQASTLLKERIITDGQFVVRVDDGDTRSCSDAGHRRAISSLRDAFDGCDAIVVSDYGYGVLSGAALGAIRALRSGRRVPLIVDSKQLRRFAGLDATVVAPNQHEARLLVDGGQLSAPMRSTPAEVERIGRALLEQLGCEHAAITLAADGVLIVSRDGSMMHLPAHPVTRAADVGAGDSFTAALAAALGTGAGVADAAAVAIDAAGISVAKPRTAVVEQQELLQRVSMRGMANRAMDALATRASLADKLLVDRLAGRRIVFTNGVFDILHAGHVTFLREARALGDVLVVGVNSDRSAAQRRGKRPPINAERNRLALISALDTVDHAVLFDEETPAELIRQLRPHLHVKGGDYEAISLPEEAAVREVGGEVAILPLAGDLSTRGLLDRIVSIAGVAGLEALHD